MAIERFKFSLGLLLLCFVLLTFDTVKATCNNNTFHDVVTMAPPTTKKVSVTTKKVSVTTKARNPCDVSSLKCKNGGARYVTDKAQCKCMCPEPWTGNSCDQIKAFNYTGCADDFIAVIADGVELGHSRKINTSVSVSIPQGTKVLGVRVQNTLLGGGWKGIATDGRYPSNTQWRCTTTPQVDNRWARRGFDASSWPLIKSQYAKPNTYMCGNYPTSAKWVWVDNYVYLGIIYCRLQIVPTDDTLPVCAKNCLSCVHAGAGLCDKGQCYPGYAYNSAKKTCDGKCAKFCARCDSNGASKCDPGKCTSGYYLDTSSKKCNPINFTVCTNDQIWLYADGIFQQASVRPNSINVKLSFPIPPFTVVLAVRDNNNYTGSAGWRGYSTDLSIKTNNQWKCSKKVPDENSWKEHDFDDSTWKAPYTSGNIYAPSAVPTICADGFPSASKFIWTDSTFASSSNATSYCRLKIDWQGTQDPELDSSSESGESGESGEDSSESENDHSEGGERDSEGGEGDTESKEGDTESKEGDSEGGEGDTESKEGDSEGGEGDSESGKDD